MSRPYGEDQPDTVGDLWLRVHHAETQRDAAHAALRKEVMAVIRECVREAIKEVVTPKHLEFNLLEYPALWPSHIKSVDEALEYYKGVVASRNQEGGAS